MASFPYLLLSIVVVALVSTVTSTPVSSEAGNAAKSEAVVKCTKDNSTAVLGAAEPEPEPTAEPKPLSSDEGTKNKLSAAVVPEPSSKEAENSKEATKPAETTPTKATTTTTTTSTTTTTEKPTAKAAVTTATTTTTTTPPPPATLKITEKAKPEAKSESLSKPAESAPLKIENREGKSINLNKTEYEHANPVPQPEQESAKSNAHPVNGTDNKNETAKASPKTTDKATTGVHETIEKKNATLATSEAKKSEDKPNNAATKKPETHNAGSDNSTTPIALPTAEATTNGSPVISFNMLASLMSLSFLIISA